MSVLGMLPPVIDENNEMLIDGAYVNNLPVDVMHSWMQASLSRRSRAGRHRAHVSAAARGDYRD